MSLDKLASRIAMAAVLILAHASIAAAQTSASESTAQTFGNAQLQAQPPVAGASALMQADSAWETCARSVQTGKKIAVTLADSAAVTGKLLGVDPQSLRIEQAGTTKVIPAARIVRIRYDGLRTRNTLYGMLAGLAVGAIATVVIDQNSAHPSSVGEAAGMGGFLLGLPIGAIAGALIPVGPPLYERPGE
ncbi:MAG TPA: hypothetical protein PKJ13_05870 [bacterium]|jgi:hypothetical protein|nr:hypothetical protein [bacterium]HOY45941.1 hypothetical protein [bacterium]HPG84919.1 hypothetical protein [bacterium]HPM60723.1 hypothetical protein [bacterium]